MGKQNMQPTEVCLRTSTCTTIDKSNKIDEVKTSQCVCSDLYQ